MSSIIGAMNNSVAAMLAQSQALGGISQNISNVSTVGYKAVDTQFRTMLGQNWNDTTAYGVAATTRNQARSQGLNQSTGNSSDLAISGKGFFVVNSQVDGSGSNYFTRNGATQSLPGTALSSTASTGLTYITDSNGMFLMGWPASSSPTASSTSASGLSALSYDTSATMAGSGTTKIVAQGTVPATSTGTLTTTYSIYDNTGTSQGLTVTLTPTGTTGAWIVSTSMDASVGTITAGSSSVLAFDSYGNTYSPTAAGDMTITWADKTTSTISVDLTGMKEYAESDSISLKGTTSDGYAPGEFQSVEFTSDGSVLTNFSNGQSVKIGTLALAQFIEPNALAAVSGTLFQATSTSGTPEYGTVSTFGSQNSIDVGALEQSTTSIEHEFTTMVVVQQAYESASKLWGVGDEMMKTVRDLIR